MRRIINSGFVISLFLLSFLFILSCSQEEIGDLKDTLYVRHEGADMPAHIYGNATEKVFLVILHGGPGGDGLTYRAGTIKSKIEKECAVVYFDQRGSGMSQGRYSEDGISVDIMAEDVLALAKVIRHKYGDDSQIFLMGHSWGGTLGTAVMLKDQNAFSGWIEVDGAHDPKGIYFEYPNNFKRVADQQIEANRSISYWEEVKNNISKLDTTTYTDDDFYEMNREAYKAEEQLADDKVVFKVGNGIQSELLVTFFFKNNPLTVGWNGSDTQVILVRDQDIFEKLSYTDRLNEITIPSLILWGKYDMVVPPKFAQDAFDNIGSSSKELVIFENSGHSPMFLEPDLFAQVVIDFINENK
ncbi:alpha/beta hydrolase [Flagellimonas sp. 389]|uniref:alpha/beta fold hydrolase n=1 Tax=Flagellimonas sp. 389 TaxID=2835862 RepID=UPI001BD617B6|nr:alpha/beta hydrolase [Flagellimonas sp. 389]MBS9463474.1 alpha/beta hydrolase [Flagellimonas sp. 389]